MTLTRADSNCHFTELLEEHEAFQLSSSSIRRILLEKGKSEKQRRRNKVHQPRSVSP